jgi:hypothetical protein
MSFLGRDGEVVGFSCNAKTLIDVLAFMETHRDLNAVDAFFVVSGEYTLEELREENEIRATRTQPALALCG